MKTIKIMEFLASDIAFKLAVIGYMAMDTINDYRSREIQNTFVELTLRLSEIVGELM